MQSSKKKRHICFLKWIHKRIILSGSCNNYQTFKAMISINEILMSLTIDISRILLMISVSIIGIANMTGLFPCKVEGNAKCYLEVRENKDVTFFLI